MPATNTSGEGFLAIDPAGTKYWFTWMSQRNVGKIDETVETGDAKFRRYYIYLQEVMFLATKIEDRFGNTVTFQYSGDAFARLLKITSNDLPTPREITFAYNAQGLISSVTDGTRTVTYRYATDAQGYSTLTSVTLPDQSKWLYDFRALSRTGGHSGVIPDHPCGRAPDQGRPPLSSYDCVGWPIATANVSASVTHPSGARGDYLLRTHYQVSGAGGYVWRYPLGVAERTTTGAGLAPMKWSYAFGPSLAETQAQCRAGACPTRMWANETGPDNKLTRRIFGVRANIDYGLMLQQREGSGGATPVWLRDTQFSYRLGASIGVLPGEGQATTPMFTNMRQLPVAERTTSQDGATFAYKVESWDAFDRPVIVRRTGSETRRDQTEYADNTALWVVGQVGRSIHLGAGGNIVESETQYAAATALPSRTFAFGKLQKSFTYDARGNIASVSDGRDAPGFDTTVLYSGWKRGLPGGISFPDGHKRLASIDNVGRVGSVTDENGFVTCYGYDAGGRLNRIDYPSDALNAQGKETCGGDRWNPMVRTFAPSTQAAFGLAAGHWVETVSTGDGRTETRFDALWRPVVVERFDATNKAATLSQVAKRYGTDGQLAYQSYPTTGITAYTTTAPGTRTTYDALGRATRVEQDAEAPWVKLVATTEYLPGFRVRTRNPMGKATTTSFKTFDQPSTDWPVSIAHPLGVTTTIARDAFGKPASITRVGGAPQIAVTRVYEYNAHQELCRRTEPETGSTLMGYDAVGNLAWSASGASSSATCVAPGDIAARISTRTYDNRNRLIDLSFGDDTGEQVWAYTPDGLAKTITTYNGVGRTIPYVNAYSYNKRRMVGGQGETGQDTTYGGTGYTWTIGYGYDRNGAVANNSYPSGQVVDYAPNALGQATKAGTYATGVRYHPNGGVHQFTYGNGVIHTMDQNIRQLPERSRDAYGSTAFLDDSYDYDANGNVLAISDGVAGNRGDRSMTYDDLDRLTSTTSPMYGGRISHATTRWTTCTP